jgi:hypothetical protein
MTDPYAGSCSQAGEFLHTSPLASSSHDPILSLSSHCIRAAFGPSVQLVADALQTRGHPVTITALIAYMKRKCPAPQRRLGVPVGVQPTDPGVVRAALLTLVQHNIVSVSYQKPPTGALASLSSVSVYTYHSRAARNLMRYAKYIEFIRRGVDESTAVVLQTLLLAGRLRTTDWITRVELPTQVQVVESIYKLASQGYVHQVKAVATDDDDDDEEYEFEAEPPTKRVRLPSGLEDADTNEDPKLLELLNGNVHYKSMLPVDSVWRVSFSMFHDQLSAYTFGRLVSERFGSTVQSCGSLVTAALRYRAHQKHVVAPQQGIAFEASSEMVSFQATDCIKYLPTPVSQQMEKKAGGVKANIKRAWDQIAEVAQDPAVVRRSSDGSRIEINLPSLSGYLQERAIHQLMYDRHGEIAARIVSILLRAKWLESDALADQAMVPAKDTREVCHLLYRSRYIEIMQLGTSRQHNSTHTIYLWGVNARRLRQRCADDVAQALWNVRLRRQHQTEEVGRHWMERDRSLQVSEVDENETETDRFNRLKFNLGLERLDVAASQLDETLLLMNDYQTF